ncbi:MAG TPA: ATP-binding protein [Candidatus Angelobacter sp.]|jgi:DNA replication protein DnaC
MNTVDGAEMNECPECHGTKLKLVTVPSKRDPTRMREAFVHCDCFFTDRSERLLKAAQIPARYANCTLSNFDVVNTSLSIAVSDIQHFVQNYPLEKMGLLLVGHSGVGKTHLAVAAIQYLIREKGIACLFRDYRELLKEIQNSYNPSIQATELEILRPVLDTEVLLLDELGANFPSASEWIWETVSYIINYRYNEKKTTIFTTNFPDAPAYNEGEETAFPDTSSREKRQALLATRVRTLGDRITNRMYSRLHEMCRIIRIQGNDFRRLASTYVLRVIPVNTQPRSETFGALEAYSTQTGARWGGPALPWEVICKYLSRLGQTQSQIETIKCVLMCGRTAEITETPEPLRVGDQQLNGMQMKQLSATKN